MSPIFKKTLTLSVILIVSLPAAAFVFPYLIPQSSLERRLAPILADEAGLELQEAKRVQLSLFPETGIALESVSARWIAVDAQVQQIRVKRIFAIIDRSALLKGRLAVQKIILESPSAAFREEAGLRREFSLKNMAWSVARRSGFDMRDHSGFIRIANTPKAAPPRALRLPSVDIEIRNGSMAISHDGFFNGKRLAISKANFMLASSRKEGLATLEGNLSLNGELVKIDGKAGVAKNTDRTAALHLVIDSAAGRTELDGQLSLAAEPALTGNLRLGILSGEALARIAGGGEKLLFRLEGTSVDGRLRLSPRQLSLSDAVLTGPGGKGDLTVLADAEGRIQAVLSGVTLFAGASEGRFMLDVTQPEAVLSGRLTVSDADALALGANLSGFDWLSGKTVVELEFAGGGASVEAVLASLSGKGKLTVSEGAIEGVDLPLILAEARDGGFQKWRRETGRRTPFDNLSASFKIVGGVARTSDLALEGQNVAMIGEGVTDLARNRIEYRLKTKVTPSAGADATAEAVPENAASLAIPLIIKGDWGKPEIYPDIENAIKDPDTIAGTAKLFGKSVEKWTDGKVKAEDFGKMIDGLFGKKKKKDKTQATEEN